MRRRIPMTMQAWEGRLNRCIETNRTVQGRLFESDFDLTAKLIEVRRKPGGRDE